MITGVLHRTHFTKESNVIDKQTKVEAHSQREPKEDEMSDSVKTRAEGNLRRSSKRNEKRKKNPFLERSYEDRVFSRKLTLLVFFAIAATRKIARSSRS